MIMEIAIGTALISTILPPMAAKAMDIIKDKGKPIARSMADKAVAKAIVNIERDISRLQTTLYTIEGIVQVAEEKQIDKQGKPVIFIQNWLRDLVDIGYEARDVLDDFITFSSYIITAYEEASNAVNFISSFMLSYFGGLSSDTSNTPLSILNRLAKDIRKVRKRFDKKKKESETFTTLISVVGREDSKSVSRPKVGSFINQQRDYLFLGRDKVKEQIMEKILRPEYDRVDVVAIWGMGGIGKTTLAQSIYNDEMVVKKVPRSWLFVGENKFSAEKVIRKILNDKETIGIGNLQAKLKEKLRGDRFLIVLDDVWDVDGSEWSLLFNPLTEVGKGGLIIITTRKREVCTATNTQTTYDLKPLSEEDSWSIFESCAYVNGKSDSTPDREEIGKEIVKKLNGHPLALKVVGCSLLDKDSSTWTNFLESNDWMLIDDDNDNNIMSVLRWSYNHLPRHLKMCFTYCSLFPKDHVFDEKLLVQMWMAHDLIQKDKQKGPEDVGAQYFEKLVKASLLQCVDRKYVMHDLIHDLALHVSNGEFATANGSLSIDQMVRHITITEDDYSEIERLRSSKKLLTLYTTRNQIYATEKLDFSVLDDVFKQLKSIRVLVLCKGIKEIPDCISELRHLRYLDVSQTSVKSFPESLCRLYNLQMIAAPPDVVLPRDAMKMVNLRYIRADLSTCKGVGKLTSLQELSSINVCEGDNIRELGDVQRLRGKLRIKGLENVEILEDNVGALMEKQKLMDELELVFNRRPSTKSTISAQVLDALGCPSNLKCLKIDGYNGLKPPCWMVDGKYKFDKLQKLELEYCPKLESLPPLGKLTSLKHIRLKCVGVKRLGDEFYGKFTDGKVFFPSLESLEFVSMREWKEWNDIIIIENSNVSFFPRLTKLILYYCPKLESLPPLGELTSLKHIHLEMGEVKRLGDKFYGDFTKNKVFFQSLESLTFDKMYRWEEWDDIIIDNSNVSFFPRLTSLKLSQCLNLGSLPPLGGFDKLQTLKLSNCFKLKSLAPHGGFDKLQTLELSYCPKLESLPPLGLLTSLKHIRLKCVGVKRLGDEFYGKFTDGKVFFPSLESLDFHYVKEWEGWDDIFIENSSLSFFPLLTTLNLSLCTKLESLPRHGGFDKLQTLNLFYCPKLKSLPPLGELTSLKHLFLENVGVKRLGDEFYRKFTDGKVFFPSLEMLCFSKMWRWEGWDDIIIQNSSMSFFPLLTTLKLSCCFKLKSLQPHGGFDKLQTLELSDCPKLESLLRLGELTSLKLLYLQEVGVKRLGDEFYGKFTDGKVFFPSLESLCFYNMEEWEEWDDIIIENSSVSFFPRLTGLEIVGCRKLVSVLPVVKNPIMNAANFMTSLSRLEIRHCYGLRSLPADGLPPSLTYLEIEDCSLLYERCKDEFGLDWHKINHIPEREIRQHYWLD